MAYFEGEVPVITNGNNGGCNGWGGSDAWVIIILFALIFGWNRNGFNGNGTNGGGTVVYDTGASLQRGFDTSGINNKLNSIGNGICDATFSLNNSIMQGNASIQSALCQGFSGVNTAIMQNGYETRDAVNNLGYQVLNGFNTTNANLASCCCDIKTQIASASSDIQRGQDRISYDMAKNTCDIIRSNQDNTREILNFLTSEKISSLQAENSALTAQLSQNAQTRTIIDSLLPVAKPAYITCSPYSSAFGYNNTCGCN